MKSRMARTATTTAVVVATAAMLAGCTPGAQLTAAETEPPAEQVTEMLSAPAEPLWHADVTPAGYAPVVIGDTVVSYVVDGTLKLMAFDAKTGDQLWYQPHNLTSVKEAGFSVWTGELEDGSLVVGQVGTPKTVGTGDSSRWVHPVRMIDPATGDVIAETSRAEKGSQFPCVGLSGLCFWGGMEAGADFVRLRLTPEGDLVPYEPVTGYTNLWPLESELQVFAAAKADGSSSLIRVEAGKVAWSIDSADLGLDGVSLVDVSGKFSYDEDRSETAAIFHFTTEDAATLRERGSYDLSTHRAVGVDIEEGKVLWEHENAIGCWSGTLCSGEMTFSITGNSSAPDAGAVHVAGMDMTTGEEKWGIDVADFGGADQKEGAATWSAPGDLAVYLDGYTPFLLDLADGTTREPGEDELFACKVDGEPFSAFEYSYTNNPIVEYTGSQVVEACAMSGSSADIADFTESVVAAGGGNASDYDEDLDLTDEQYRAVATADGIYGFLF